MGFICIYARLLVARFFETYQPGDPIPAFIQNLIDFLTRYASVCGF